MKRVTTCLTLVLSLLLFCATAQAADQIRFGVPPWPGVEVKTEVASQILNTLGYETESLQIGPPVIYSSFSSGEVDVFLGGWVPQQNSLLNPQLESGAAEIAQTNLDNALISLCVPKYAAEAGVKSFADLDKHGEKFNRHIYNIEVGSPMHTAMDEIIANDVAGLGDWQQTGTTTSAMLMEAKSRMDNKEWVAFACWRPHWMNVKIDMAYLEPVPGTEKFASESKVHTVVRGGLKDTHPQVYRFLKNLKVDSRTQSLWIMDYGQNEIPADEVAAEWISANKSTVAKWLDGVKAADGTPAMEKIEQAF
ncbi:ABC transporter substrate-binding protein [Desulfohalovibrio reitneri]|uniref:ABC transporter substrate-binding protein n=1 Tax=Desulfohalovibrio reitneri TaxID=1307759 RepID=UPI0004A70F92|nr:ABC transporter substrate-binding protein [Desulfohalovibrio reitneri]